jgi:nitroreductase
MSSMLESIKQRYSVRTYQPRLLEKEARNKIISFLQSNIHGPFGNKVRFDLVEIDEKEKNQLKEFGTYGMIKGVRLFIAGAVIKGEKAMEDYGYCMEKNILFATSLGLGTCWLGGTFKRSAFGKKLGCSEHESVPAVSPLGYALEKMTIRDSFLRFSIGAKKRKDFGELFFNGSLETPLTPIGTDNYHTALACVRIAPSASNKQPWRIIKEKERPVFHFYISEDRLYSNVFKEIRIQNVDLGIAMCNFDLAANELGFSGTWQVNDPQLNSGKLRYCTSWAG